jgi:alpha-beta hydrolase superfamily lysophospholipase
VRLFVDAMNVIGSRPDGWWRDRHAAMERLVAQLEDLAAGGDEITVFFERQPEPAIESESVEVAHAPVAIPNAADDEIVRRLAVEPSATAITVVTSDRRLAARARAIGARVEGASEFRRRLRGEHR